MILCLEVFFSVSRVFEVPVEYYTLLVFHLSDYQVCRKRLDRFQSENKLASWLSRLLELADNDS